MGRELGAGANTGILAAAQALTHGMIAFAPLGPEGAAFGMAAALAASAVAGVVVAWLGSSRPLVGTTTAATALVTATLLATMGPLPMGQGILLAMLLAVLGGATMVLLGLSGFARLAALAPTPVTMGIVNAIVLLVVVGQVPLLLGLAPGQGWSLPAMQPGAALVAGVAVLLMLRPWPKLPAPLVALVAAGVLQHGLEAAGVPVGPLVGVAPGVEQLGQGMAEAWREGLPPTPWAVLLPAAVSLALLGALEVLVAGNALREASGRRARSGRDVTASGLGMMAGGALGGAPAAALVSNTMACWRWGGRGRAALLMRAAIAGAVLLLAGQAAAQLPFAALSGVLVGAVMRLIQWPDAPWRAGNGRARRAGDLLVILSVMAAALVFGLVAAVGVGVLLSILIFTASMATSPIRRVTRNPVGRSRIRRPAGQERALRQAGEAIALLELEGAIFFGSAERVLLRAEAECAAGASVLILDLSRVTRIDLSGGRRLIEVCRVAPGRVLLAPLHEHSRAMSELQALSLFARLPEAAVQHDLPAAVEVAEGLILGDTLTDRPQAPGSPRAALLALGLPPSAVGPLLALCTERYFTAGSDILRQGEPADAAYLLLSGEVLIRLPPGPARPATRLAVLAPGVIFGEAALLGQARRSADAIARGAVHCLRMDAAAAERLRNEAPGLAWHLMATVARQLALHVSAANAVIDRLES